MSSSRDADRPWKHISLLPLRIVAVVVGAFVAGVIVGIPVIIGGLFLLVFAALSASCDGTC
jgi:hypothetical protein